MEGHFFLIKKMEEKFHDIKQNPSWKHRELDGVGPVDNRPYTNKLHYIV